MAHISGLNTEAARPLTAVGKIWEAPRTQRPGEDDRPRTPVMDEYVPEEPREPTGRYWMGRDGDGRPTIYFDDPECAANAPEGPKNAAGAERPDTDAPEAAEPEKADKHAGGPEKGGKKEGRCVADTGKVDREIERLKKRRRELEQRLNAETDETKIRELERQLTQVEQELREKDNDAYRKRHCSFTQLP